MGCLIIAEAGVNHNGDMALAHRLVDAAADGGADVVKFQTFFADRLVTDSSAKAPYQVQTTGSGGQLELLRSLELAPECYAALKAHAEARGILFASTAFDLESVDFLDKLGVPFHKIPSGEITNYPLLRHIAAKSKPIVLSTGMSSLDEVRRAADWIGKDPQPSERLPALTVLHCVTAYPAPIEQLNLRCIETLARDLCLPIGYSDHSVSIDIPVVAVVLGATVIEKHFTLDQKLPGPDHAASLEPAGLVAMVTAIRQVERALGNGIKNPAPCEMENLVVVRRALVARRSIRKGERFTSETVTSKRPATGLSPALWPEVMGRVASRDFTRDEPIEI